VIADTGHHQLMLADAAGDDGRPVALDESWLGTAVGPPLVAASGDLIPVTYDFDPGSLALDGSGGPPVGVQVSADPGTLLAAGPRRWALGELSGSVELVAGDAGEGVVVVELEVAADSTTVRSRTRHDLTVTATSGVVERAVRSLGEAAAP
jgi:hypothetical protein